MQAGKCTKHKLKLAGASNNDSFECKRLSLPGVTLHLRLHRSINDFSLQSLADSDAKYAVVIEGASVYVTSKVLKHSVRLSFEKALINASVHYPSIERMDKSFIIQAEQNSFWKENVSGTDVVRRSTLCMATNEQFRGRRDTCFWLSTICSAKAWNYTWKLSSNSGITAGCAEWKDESPLLHHLFTWLFSVLWITIK